MNYIYRSIQLTIYNQNKAPDTGPIGRSVTDAIGETRDCAEAIKT